MAVLDTTLWVATGMLAVVYLMTGVMKLMDPAKAQGMSPVLGRERPPTLRVIGSMEVLGALGVVLPPAFDVVPWLAGVAAIGLGLIQVLAIPRHIRLRDTKMLPMNIGLLVLAGFVAWGRLAA